MAKDQIDFGELSGDTQFKERINNFHCEFAEISKIIDHIVTNDVYDSLQPEDKIRYDLFLSFAINSLYWFYLRTQGKDPSQHDLKNEISRVKEYMTKSRKLYERKTIMPRIDQGAAKRFVRSGLFDLNKAQEENTNSTLKRKRDENDD